jgi:hypothetical protein
MKSQIPIFNDKNRFGIWNFGHCDLFGIFSHSKTPKLQNCSTPVTAQT